VCGPADLAPPRLRLRGLVVLAAVVWLGALPGCVQRRLMIRSNPPGALVYVDDYEIGTTPVSTDFTYYGTRKIRLVKDGYETLTVLQPVPAPWYEIPPLDFFSENLVPGEIRDRRVLTYQLRPQMVVPTDQLLQRAQGLRTAAQGPGGVMAAPVAAPAPGMGTYAPPSGTYPPPAPPGSGGMPVHALPGPGM